MLLIVNIGNSNIRLGFFQETSRFVSWVLESKSAWTEEKLSNKLNEMYAIHNVNPEQFSAIAVGSVVPSLTAVVCRVLEKTHGLSPYLVTNATPSNVKHSSDKMGADLYANAVAAHAFYEGKKIVVDFGTALTFIGINEEGQVMGVSIGPGVLTALNSLIKDTAQLQEIELKVPESVLGKNTEACMQSGVLYGFLGMVEGMLDRINQEFNSEFTVIATGGLSSVFAPLTTKIHYQDQLHTLKGIAELYYYNHPK